MTPPKTPDKDGKKPPATKKQKPYPARAQLPHAPGLCQAYKMDGDLPKPTMLDIDQAMKDLRDMTLDGQVLSGIDFTGADLRGANISDAIVYGAIFAYADLVDVCMADSVFENCDFSNARFGATIIRGCRFINCRFAGPACLLLPWLDTNEMSGNIYVTACDRNIPFDVGVFVLWGAPDLIASVGDVMLVNDFVTQEQ